jgi:hypothetical protein
MERLWQGLRDIVTADPPMTVRQVFYLAVAAGLVQKTEAEYDNAVGRGLLHLRRTGRLPWHMITDGTRWRRKVPTHDSVEAALEATARAYRRSLWTDQAVQVEVWTEKDTLAGVLWEVVDEWDIPLMVSRGFTSDTYCYEAAQDILRAGKPAFLYYLGDHDPSGVCIDRVIERKLRTFAPAADIRFTRIAVLPWQIEEWHLPSRPTKRSDSRSKTFEGQSVEVDAIPAEHLRALVRQHIEAHVDQRRLAACRAAERSEREILTRLASTFTRG